MTRDAMKEILDKLSSYNLFNNLLPGVLFTVAMEHYTGYVLTQANLLLDVFVYYFVGLGISRFGSLVLEPILKKVSFLKFASYPDFVAAARVDPKLEILSEVNNTYRSVVATAILLLLVKGYSIIAIGVPVMNEYGIPVLLIAVIAMFLFAYRKQTAYIVERVRATKK